ncbi:TetR/AcrR family transcriptional regulator [Agromyces mediolanus]|uniref:TetR/AcrR family transcriptional regulator n=1 Tax=Agromyces mediolanus TaxID=41986 RepID=UPI002040741B|nr:TetR/AcrR family transcriptional regulator [Agromyces mediolanus]MCM3658895.1 TetR/AcrR family transcriptional regulator [Agromyces mediolanus]
MEQQAVTDGRRARGDASRRVVLAQAVDLASIEGLDQLSIARIAEAAGVGKSSVATLFGSKERLQLATVETASARFAATVIAPARVHPRGVRRLVALLDRVVAYSQDRVFPGGCFFSAAAADFHAKPGQVRDAVAAQLDDWLGYLALTARFAAERGELPGLDPAGDDPEQLAFEIQGTFELMNLLAVIRDDELPYLRARRAYRARLLALGVPAELAERVLVPGAALR